MVNVHAYDYHGYWWGTTGHHSPISRMDSILKYYVSAGLSKDKVNVGLPFYGQTFLLDDPSQVKNVGAKAKGPGPPGLATNQQGMMSYAEICKMGKII